MKRRGIFLFAIIVAAMVAAVFAFRASGTAHVPVSTADAAAPTEPQRGENKLSAEREKLYVDFLQAYVAAINAKDINLVEKYHAPGAVTVGPWGVEMRAKERRQYFRQRVRAFPDALFEVTSYKVEPKDEKTVTLTYDFKITGRQTGRFMDVEATRVGATQAGSCSMDLTAPTVLPASASRSTRTGQGASRLPDHGIRIIRDVSVQNLSGFTEKLRGAAKKK